MCVASGYGVTVFGGGNSSTLTCSNISSENASYTKDVLTVTVGSQTVWSSEFAPTLIFGGLPVRLASLVSAECVNSFRESMPVQSGHLSCSILNDKRVFERGWLDGGAMTGSVAVTLDWAETAGTQVNARDKARGRSIFVTASWLAQNAASRPAIKAADRSKCSARAWGGFLC